MRSYPNTDAGFAACAREYDAANTDPPDDAPVPGMDTEPDDFDPPDGEAFIKPAWARW